MNEIVAFSYSKAQRADEYLYFMRQIHIEKIVRPGGWGAAFIYPKSLRLFHDTSSLRTCSHFSSVITNRFETPIFLGGITRIRLEDEENGLDAMQPIVRESNGKYWTFVQSGDLRINDNVSSDIFKSVGSSAGEKIFSPSDGCYCKIY
jgi:predicted glutamine amidotransferase